MLRFSILRRLVRPLLVGGGVLVTTACSGGDAPSIRIETPSGVRSSDTSAPLKPPATAPAESALRFTTLTAGLRFSCGLDGDGRAWCWGANRQGQLGVGDSLDRFLPTPVATTTRFVQIVAGETHACGVDASGQLHCWGDNRDRELGDSLGIQRDVPSPVRRWRSVRHLALGARVTCVTDPARVVSCWGTDTHGERGDARHDTVPRAEAEAVRTSQRFDTLAAGRHHVCGLTSERDTYCWGGGALLGDGTITDRTTPVRVRTTTRFVSLTAGESVTCGLDADGHALCWGIAFDGQLGQGEPPRPNTFVPAPVAGVIRFRQLSAGKHRVCGLDLDGAAWCWGSNYNGGLGNGGGGSEPAPVRVSGGHRFTMLAAGDVHTCGLDEAGRAWCWGENADARGGGALGDGTLRSRNIPVPVAPPDAMPAEIPGVDDTSDVTRDQQP